MLPGLWSEDDIKQSPPQTPSTPRPQPSSSSSLSSSAVVSSGPLTSRSSSSVRVRSPTTPTSPSATLASTLGSSLSLRTVISRVPAASSSRPASPSPASGGSGSNSRARAASRTPRSAAPTRRTAASSAANTAPQTPTMATTGTGAPVAPAPVAVAAAAAGLAAAIAAAVPRIPGGNANHQDAAPAGAGAILPTGQNRFHEPEPQPAPAVDLDDFKVQAIRGASDGRILYKTTGGKPFRRLPQLFNHEFLSDLEIVLSAGDDFRPPISLRAHKAIVCAQSKYFQKCLDADDAKLSAFGGSAVRIEGSSSSISLDETTPLSKYPLSYVVDAIGFMYTGRILLMDATVIDYFMISNDVKSSFLSLEC
eukprot:TRINITY_DN8660_c0_g1_i1.p1 TRINITY_DN8660_c0_g1~~TRINITY_DN8660_c0_g1_i1.p1  ORF type:complete len:365 (+),score=104.45 TRINITY_DN8660_c0_g1_i1:29-1123(+)